MFTVAPDRSSQAQTGPREEAESFSVFYPRKMETENCVVLLSFPSLSFSCSSFPTSPTPPTPTPPSGSWSSLISPRGRRGKGQGSSVAFSKEKKTENRATLLCHRHGARSMRANFPVLCDAVTLPRSRKSRGVLRVIRPRELSYAPFFIVRLFLADAILVSNSPKKCGLHV